MVVKVYISGISGNKEVKKRQQRVLMILDSKTIKYDVIDITEPGKETDKDFMQNNSKSNGGTVSDPNPRSPLPPQLFNDDEYCGDYDQFDLANEVDTLEQFLKLEVPPEQPEPVENDKEQTLNGDASKGPSQEREVTENDEPAENDTTDEKEKSPVKDGTSRDATPDKTASKETTPAKDDKEPTEVESTKESSPERQTSVEKESTPAKEESPVKEVEEPEAISKEATPEKESVNENGTVSSRDQSQEKEVSGDSEVVDRKKEPSELLIESEQAAAE